MKIGLIRDTMYLKWRYRDHPVHQLVIAERIKPHITARAAVQYQYGAH